MPADGEAAAGKTNFASMLTSLHIQNFRAFRDLKLDGLARVNLITGANNVGKTGLLEALVLMLSEPNGWQVRDLPKRFRSASPNSGTFADFWEWLPTAGAESKLSSFAEVFDGTERKVQFYEFRWDQNSKLQDPVYKPSLYELGQVGRNYGAAWVAPKDFSNKVATFSTHPSDPKVDATRYNRIILKKRRRKVEALLQKVEPRLESIDSVQANGDGPALYADIGLSELIPASQLGQGFNRLLDIYSELVAEEAKVLLIDEIENGLYWKALPIVWKGLFAAARELDVQIFATTHSLECIKAADEAARAEGSYDLALIRLDRVGDDIKPTVMGEEAMRTAREFGWEIR